MEVLGWPDGSRDSKEEMPANLNRVTTMRGLEALLVAFGHSLMVLSVDGLPTPRTVPFTEFPGIESLLTKALLLLSNRNSAIMIFFVISGFVLGLSLDRGIGWLTMSYLGLMLRRVFRIYPALILSLFVVGTIMPWIMSLVVDEVRRNSLVIGESSRQVLIGSGSGS